MKKMTAILAGLAGLAGLAAPAQSAEFELKISTMFPSTHFIQTLALEPWAEAIEERTDGRVNFTFFPAGSSMGDATRQFDQARSGVVDVSVGIPATAIPARCSSNCRSPCRIRKSAPAP